MDIDQLAPSLVAERMGADDDAVYLDVRSEQEFLRGHAAGALNVPIFHVDPATGQPFPNQQFMAIVESVVPKEAPVYVGCASGQRSLQAAQLMLANGYQNVANVDGGFSGKRDPFGNLLLAGWADSGLAVDDGDGGDRSYRSLSARASESAE